MKSKLFAITQYTMIITIAAFSFPMLQCRDSSADEKLDPDAAEFIAEFTPIPDKNSDVWREVPREEWIAKLQFLVDQGKSNYQRIRTWSGTYDVHKKHYLDPPRKHNGKHTEEDAKSVKVQESYSFFCNLIKNECFMNKFVMKTKYHNPSGKPLETSSVRLAGNFSAVLTSKEAILYEYGQDSDQIRPELKGELEGRIGKICTIKSPEDAIEVDIGMISSVFDPRYFFLDSLTDNRGTWANIENAMLPWLQGKGTEKYKAKAENGITLLEANVDDVVWYYLIYKDNEFNTRSERVYNSKSNYNLVYCAGFSNGKYAERYVNYVKIDNIYIPDKWMLIYDSHFEGNRNLRYFKLVDCQLNQPIPDSQFTMEALSLPDDVVVMNDTNSTLYEYTPEKKLSPISKYWSAERIIPMEPLWRSPVRLTAVAVGIALLIGGVIYKFRKRRKDA